MKVREGLGNRVGSLVQVMAAGALVLAAPQGVNAQPYGIDSRVSNTTLLIDAVPNETPAAMSLTRVFSPLTFNNPLNMVEGFDGSNRLYVGEKRGRVRVFDKDDIAAGATDILNIESIVQDNGEMGFLGLALDPDYNNAASPFYGHLYVYYSYGLTNNSSPPAPSRISRFVNPDPTTNGTIPTASETVLMEFAQPFNNHNGGWISFGPDGMLYVGVGDGGSGGDPGNRAQNLNEVFGKFLRLDVHGTPDPGLQYRIPPDNPFYNTPSTRREIWAYGVRNPWRSSFDQQTGILYCGDVGQNIYEEVDIIKRGLNYGWRRMEGLHCFNPATNCNVDPNNPLTLPIVEYDHSLGQSITGGYVYYGSAVPELYGQYIYGDYVTGRIWALRYDGSVATSNIQLIDATINIPAFAQDSTGEVYVFSAGSSATINVLRPAVAPPPPTGVVIPNQLSAVPALFNAGKGIDQTDQGVVPYRPVAQLWSDGGLKERFLALPGLSQMTYSPANGWDMPDKTVIVKNFLLPMDDRDPAGTAQRIETRVMFRLSSQWYGYSYEWNGAGTEAQLVAAAGKQRPFTRIDELGATYSYNWLYPSRSQCFQCHTPAANFVLGLNTAQMNCEFPYPDSGVTDNQLRTMDHIALFDAPLPAAPDDLPRMPDPFGTAKIGERAKAYLAANCSMCHQPGGGAPGSMDLRWQTLADAMNAISAVPSSGSVGLVNPRILYPGRADRSVMVARVESLGSIRMPPVASSKVDPDGSQLIRDWLAYLGANQDSDGDAFSDLFELDGDGDPFSTAGAPTLGDVDGAAGYTVADVTEYHNFLAGQIGALSQPGNGDVTGDSVVNQADADRVASYLVGNIPVLR